jgi:lipoprotein-releasing system permease protein
VSFSFERFVAWRYLRGAQGRAEGRNFLRFITYVAIGGVAVGVAALLLSLAIVRGFSQEIQSKILGFGAHVQVQNYMSSEALSPADALADQIRVVTQVEAVRPVVEDFVLLRRSAESIDGVSLVGVDSLPAFMTNRSVGTPHLDLDNQPRSGLIVGRQLAERLGIEVGDTVTAFSLRTRGEESPAQLIQPRVKQFHVSGIYETSLADFDDLYVFSSLQAARELHGIPSNQVTRFDVTVQSIAHVDSIAARIENQMGFPVQARTIYQQYQGLFAWVNLQQNIIPLVISVIVLVASFNIIGILLMMILEKTREIGVLGSLGASGRQLRRLFLTLGALIGLVGIGVGELLALALGYAQMRFEIIPLPAEAYYMSTAPVSLNPIDFLIVAAVAFILCLAAAYIPARVASRIEPVQAIRFE